MRLAHDIRDQIFLIQLLHSIKKILIIGVTSGVFHDQKAARQDPVQDQKHDAYRERNLQRIQKQGQNDADEQRNQDDIQLIADKFTDFHK